MTINKQELRLTAEKAKDNFMPNFMVPTRDVLSLLDELETAEKSNVFLKGQLAELANFNPDWDKLEASYESWREIAAELLVAKDRIAELEAREVKLPERYEIEMQPLPAPNGEWYSRDDVLSSLASAGIRICGGE